MGNTILWFLYPSKLTARLIVTHSRACLESRAFSSTYWSFSWFVVDTTSWGAFRQQQSIHQWLCHPTCPFVKENQKQSEQGGNAKVEEEPKPKPKELQSCLSVSAHNMKLSARFFTRSRDVRLVLIIMASISSNDR